MAAALPSSSSKSKLSPRPKPSFENSPEAKELRLHQLIDTTYEKIEILRRYLTKEAAILGTDVQDEEVNAVLQRQNHLMNRAISCFSNYNPQMSPLRCPPRDSKRMGGRKPSVSFKIEGEEASPCVKGITGWPSPNLIDQQNQSGTSAGNHSYYFENGSGVQNIDSVDGEVKTIDASWCGSLDRSYGKKKRESLDKRRRHTKTIGSMAGLDFIKKSHELQPDEQYEIGLPRVSRPTSRLYRNELANIAYTKLPSWTTDELDKSNHAVTSTPVGNAPNPSRHYHQRQQSGIAELDYFKLSGGRGDIVLEKEAPKAGLLDRSGASHSQSDLSFPVGRSNVDGGTMQQSQTFPAVQASNAGREGSSSGSGISVVEGIESSLTRLNVSGTTNDCHEINSNASSDSWAGFANESTKPFEMSDYYKYSTKFRTPKQDGDGNFTPISALSPSSSTSFPEDRKFNSENFFGHRGVEDALHRRPSSKIYTDRATESFPISGNRNEGPRLVNLSQGSPAIQVPLDEERKNYLINYFARKAEEEIVHSRTMTLDETFSPMSAPAIMQTPLSEGNRINLIDYFTQKAAEEERRRHPELTNRHDKNGVRNFNSFAESVGAPLSEEKKRYLIEYYTRKSVEDEAYRHPKPSTKSEGTTRNASHFTPGFSILPISSDLRPPQTPERPNRSGDYGNRKAEGTRNNNFDHNQDYLKPELPPKYSRNLRSATVVQESASNSNPTDELLAWMPDSPTFV